MVRIVTFVGLCAGTLVGVKALDNLVVWMAERREANMDNYKLEREAAHLKQQLLREIREKEATTPNNGPQEKHQMHPDKHYEFPFKHLKQQYDNKLQSKHREDKQLDEKHGEQHNNHAQVKQQKVDDHQKLPDEKPLKGQNDQKLTGNEPENCPGEVHAECLECGETFDIVEPVPHLPKDGVHVSTQTDSPTSMI